MNPQWVTRVLIRSGLPAYWADRYHFVREPERAAAARSHVAEAVSTLPPLYRWAWVGALRALPAAFWLSTGHRLAAAPAGVRERGMTRVQRLPAVGSLLRASTALALYGALDGVRERTPTALRHARRHPAGVG